MRVPVSTYRLQMTREFGFAPARELVPYLYDLGITDVYLSPILKATSGSAHGYDVVDPTRLDPKLGTREEFDAFSDALIEREMGLVLDIVPNHMAASVENPWWHHVLLHGQDSEYADYFDINWKVGGGRLLLPVLGAPLEEVIASGELTVEDGEVRYWDQRFPVSAGPAAEGGSSPCGNTAVAEVLEEQHYTLAHWRDQATRINYRRFFDISGLVAMHVERPHVFDAMHGFVLELVREGRVTGLRVDHVDGLHDPSGYLERLQEALRDASGKDEPFWVVVEKILSPVEQLPMDWQVAGTTGYDFLDACDGLFVDERGSQQLERFYDALCGGRQSFHQIVTTEKRRVMRTLFGSELRMLANWLEEALGRAFTADELTEAIIEVTTHLPVYRTYVGEEGLSDSDRALIEGAVAASPPSRAVRALHEILLTQLDFTMRWQQFTGPVTAKAVEDTAFYRYYALPERNEVGAHPDDPTRTEHQFHLQMRRRRQSRPYTMNTTSTHDTKRSEDVRARLAVLTQLPDEWQRLVRNLRKRYEEPDPHDAYLVYATLAAAPSLEGRRLREYLLKAAREAKLNTSWTEQNERYERRLTAFAAKVREDEELRAFAERIAEPGRKIALTELLLKLVAPGVPDIYQGTEIEQLTLVDPDNRRPVDYEKRRTLLDRLEAELASGRQGEEASDPDVAWTPEAGERRRVPAKLRLTAAGLRLRRDWRGVFVHGDYDPVVIDGPCDRRVVGLSRHYRDQWVIALAPHHVINIDCADDEVVLPEGAPTDPTAWTDMITGLPIDSWQVGRLLAGFPVALLATGPGLSARPASS